MEEPKVLNVLQENGEVDDMIDYIVNNKLLAERGMGFTACQPSLVSIEIDGESQQVIQFGIDHTYVDSDSGEVMGYGIVGKIYASIEEDPTQIKVLYITSKEELDENVQYILENDIEAQPRPRGKY